MPISPLERLDQIDRELAIAASPKKLPASHLLLVAKGLAPRNYVLVAQGDSWFDYPLGWDIVNQLRDFGHTVHNLARAGSTLNDLVYGPVPTILGIPESRDPSRLAVLVQKIRDVKPQALIFSGSGNDVAGPEFFSFINHAASSLPNPNADVLAGVVDETFRTAYELMIETVTEATVRISLNLPIFVHGYDYPFPDGRGVDILGLFGPWFDPSFNKKGYPRDTDLQLLTRKKILGGFVDALNGMLQSLENKYGGVVYYVDLRNTLPVIDDWANELHPRNDGFQKLADKVNLRLHQVLK